MNIWTEKQFCVRRYLSLFAVVIHCHSSRAYTCFRAVQIQSSQSCYCPSVQEPGTQGGAWLLLSPWMVCKCSSERVYGLFGRLPDSHSSEFLPLSWLRERETLLEVLGVTRWIHQETSAF